ncbi:uncharacterized protein MKK02DRAFT_38642 [Dioszegia hungarica]|uniref:Transmembrane protein n=1 Tax=Dioszegia hungarica TaxID=4972 RepID=A0AA38H700_9TREE|nr:uncharacterized protein MKK02DRAFT_38642 [Dioszegia hungarica]KAI9633971.1 hypothetical protein MKK02DRAFT_38642 [Dioszegia hungarica]
MSSSARYQPIPSSDTDSHLPSDPSVPETNTSLDVDADDVDTHRPLRASVQAEFNRQPPAMWKRLLLLAVILGLGWFSFSVARPKPRVIYAQRYSEEFKYRPAASPIITETLKDGRLRIRGASLGGTGVREEDVPRSPAQIAHDTKVRVEEARKKAREKVRDARRAAKKVRDEARGKGKGKKAGREI